ncbi:MAG: 1-phosphofructokinase family hexose kinase [Peptoniphilaceae bacterium]
MKVLTVTLNPSVDISYKFTQFKYNASNRCSKTVKTAGGKGLNVSRVLKQLGVDVLATGFLGGSLGEFIRVSLNNSEIENSFVNIQGETRNCIAILTPDEQTEILEAGPIIKDEDRLKFIEKFKLLSQDVDMIVISGSAPRGLDESIFEEMFKIGKDKKVIADISGEVLKKAVFDFEFKPFAIKPNLDEFKSLMNLNKDLSYNDIVGILNKEVKEIDLVLLTLSKDGAIAKYNDDIYRVKVPEIKAINPVGSGDSTVAGLAYGILNNLNFENVLKISSACGMSNALHQETGYIDLEEVDNFSKEIIVEKLC